MAQVSIRFAAPGTRSYTVGNDVVGGVMKMEAIGAGGAGGTATVNSGGGGKGGAYARRNAQAVTAGQTLTVTVAPSVAAAAGTASSVGTGGGTSGTIGQQSFTVTGGGDATNPRSIGATVKVSGTPNFVAASGTISENITIPAATQTGDYIFLCVYNYGATSPYSVSGYQKLFSASIAGAENFSIHQKVADASDAGKVQFTGINAQDVGANNRATTCVVYRGGTAFEFIGAIETQSAASPVRAPGFSGATSDRAIFFIATVSATNGSIAPPSGVIERVEVQDGQAASRALASANEGTPTGTPGTTILSAAGGNVGGNGSATAGGTGATAQNGTSTGDVTFTGGNGANGTLTAGGRGGGGAGDASNTTGPGPNTQFGVSRGTGGLSAAAGQVYGGGGGGATTLAARGAGASGIVVLTYSTGVGSITHNSTFNRRITAFRRVVASITHSAVFNRLVTIRRMFTASVTHVSRALKTIKLRKTASVTHLAAYTRKALRLRKTAGIVHTPFIRRALRVLRTASIVHTPVFKRLVTLRRRFVASVQHRARMLVKLEARLIPREGGGGTVTNVFRNLFLFDD